MIIQFKEAKNIITKSNIPGVDFVINPYIGCQHGCIYCYAEFMKRFTDHKGENWGDFLDIKQFNIDKIKPEKYNGKTILISSVTDPYIPLELKYKNTQKILECLIGTKAKVSILTKSRFAERDIKLFKKYENIEVGISICTLNENFAKIIEPLASKPEDRLNLIEKLHKNGIKTYIFISPIFPKITEYIKIVENSLKFTDYFMFENLNFRPHNVSRIFNIINNNFPELLSIYKDFQRNHSNWDKIEKEINNHCKSNNIQYLIEFHHGGFSNL